MQIACVKCSAPLDADFGMVKCKSCGELMLVDLLGEVQSAGKPEGTNPKTPVAVDEKNKKRELTVVPGSYENVGEVGAWSYDPKLVEEHLTKSKRNPLKDEELAGRKEGDLGELVDYANSDISGGRDGIFLYHIFIDGIETKDLRNAVGEALTDRKFAWDPNVLMAGLKKGRLVLRNVNAAKASVLVRRLKIVGVQVTWEQHAISQLDLD